jgi:hypothetical protein
VGRPINTGGQARRGVAMGSEELLSGQTLCAHKVGSFQMRTHEVGFF